MDNLLHMRKTPGKILVVKPSSLGDIVHSLPFLNVLKDRFPTSEIHWVVAKGFECLLEDHPMIQRLWVINKDAWKNIKNAGDTLITLKHLFNNLKREQFDLVADLQGLLRSGIITAATGAPIRLGFEEAREGSRYFYTHRVEGGKDIHAVDRYLKIAKFLGCDTSTVFFPFPLSFSPSLATFNPLLSGDYAVIVPGARWKTKIWPAEHFAKLAAALPVKSVIIGSRTDKDTAETIISLSGGKARSLAGMTNLKELIEVMRNALFVVTNDSGPMHIAAALQKPVFAVFGPTDPNRTGPYGAGHTIISGKESCAPCFKKTCKDIRCMKSVEAEAVIEAINNKMQFR
jgi:heptosyltransferase-1